MFFNVRMFFFLIAYLSLCCRYCSLQVLDQSITFALWMFSSINMAHHLPDSNNAGWEPLLDIVNCADWQGRLMHLTAPIGGDDGKPVQINPSVQVMVHDGAQHRKKQFSAVDWHFFFNSPPPDRMFCTQGCIVRKTNMRGRDG